jgi:hypothetical protein
MSVKIVLGLRLENFGGTIHREYPSEFPYRLEASPPICSLRLSYDVVDVARELV